NHQFSYTPLWLASEVAVLLFRIGRRRLPASTLFPYTTLFRSLEASESLGVVGQGLGQHLDGHVSIQARVVAAVNLAHAPRAERGDRKSTRLNSSHVAISYAVFCLKKTTWSGRAMPCKTGTAHV